MIGLLPEGLRANAYITGGNVCGPKLCGKLRPAGGDWLTVRTDGIVMLDVRATIETHNYALIYLAYTGIVDLGESGRLRPGPAAGEWNPDPFLTSISYLSPELPLAQPHPLHRDRAALLRALRGRLRCLCCAMITADIAPVGMSDREDLDIGLGVASRSASTSASASAGAVIVVQPGAVQAGDGL